MSVQREWRVHIGAHKTATTHFQGLLRQVSAQVEARGGAGLLKESVRRPARRSQRHLQGVRRISNDFLVTLAGKRLRRQTAGSQLVVASDEDLLGDMAHLLGEQFYPNLAGLDFVRRLAGGEPLSLYISIRGYDGLLTSTCFQMLRRFSDARERVLTAAERVAAGGGWPELFDRISRRLPGVPITFWMQERYAAETRAIIEGFLGITGLDLAQLDRPERTRSPSAAALPEVEALDPELSPDARAARVREIYRKYPADAPAEILPADVSKVLTERFETDLAELRARYPELGR
ncbi:MAG: hypothetical protein ACFBRM_13485 [Pikeienuella sp.]